MESQSEVNNEVFIGARSLKEQVTLILPTYNFLLEQIEQIRNAAKNKKVDTASKKENNNTIGIFGSRGTGKTSALYTIMQELEKKKNSNIILPIIEPDNFGENTKIMGSIIGLLSDAVDEELEKIKELTDLKYKDKFSGYFNNCIYKENNLLKLKRDELIEYHLYTENEYRNLLTHNFDDTATHIKKSSYLLKPDIEFKIRLISLVNLLIDVRKELGECEETPLIFIFIDDIDLKTNRCKELIDSILQYANHPNIITLLSGDYDILKESLTLALIADENLNHSNLHPNFPINDKDTIIERKKYLANEYLKKIIPPARRHNVVNWSITTIPNFAFGNKTLAIQLNELMEHNNFFGYQEGDKVVPIKYGYSIFDKTPRGLVNVYYHMYQIIKAKNEKIQSNEELFKNVKSLIDTIINSSSELVDEQQNFFEACLLWGNSAESTFIEYNQIPKYVEINNLDSKSNYIINKNVCAFFIICEILKELIKDIDFNEHSYIECRNFVLKVLYLDPKDKLINKITDSKQHIVSGAELSYIHTVVLPIAQNTNFKSALLLLQYITSSNFKEGYYYNNDKIYKYEKDRNVFIAICKLVNNNESDLLKNLYLKSYDDKDSSLKTTFEFLNEICTTREEYSINKKIFNLLLENISKGNIFKENNKVANLFEMFFINTLIEIQNLDGKDIEAKVKKLDEKNKYIKQYKIVKNINKPDKFSNITERQKNSVNKIIENLGKDIYMLLNEKETYKLKIKDVGIFEKAKNNFIGVYSGTVNTVYSRVKNEFSNIQELNFYLMNKYGNYDIKKNYAKKYNAVKNLSNNCRVWYGRQEAVQFLEILKQQFYLDMDMDILEIIIPLIYELGIYLKNINPYIKEDIDFEKYKKEMKFNLANAFKSAKKELEVDFQEMGSSLEEDEINFQGAAND